MTEFELLQNGIGRHLSFLGRAGLMVSITLRAQLDGIPDYQIHLDTNVAIFLNGVEYTSSNEIDDDMPYGACEFDIKAETILLNSCEFCLKKIFYDEMFLLHLLFDNGLEIHTCAVSPKGSEMWRIFLSWTADIHLIGHPEGVIAEQSSFSQKELDARKTFSARDDCQKG